MPRLPLVDQYVDVVYLSPTWTVLRDVDHDDLRRCHWRVHPVKRSHLVRRDVCITGRSHPVKRGVCTTGRSHPVKTDLCTILTTNRHRYCYSGKRNWYRPRRDPWSPSISGPTLCFTWNTTSSAPRTPDDAASRGHWYTRAGVPVTCRVWAVNLTGPTPSFTWNERRPVRGRLVQGVCFRWRRHLPWNGVKRRLCLLSKSLHSHPRANPPRQPKRGLDKICPKMKPHVFGSLCLDLLDCFMSCFVFVIYFFFFLYRPLGWEVVWGAGQASLIKHQYHRVEFSLTREMRLTRPRWVRRQSAASSVRSHWRHFNRTTTLQLVLC